MERILIVGLLFCLGHNFVCAKTEYFFVIGKSLELRPLPGVANIESIAWRHKGNFVAEWAKDKIPLEIYPAFKGRTTLDIKTGHLKIDSMTENDAGEFSVEINSIKRAERYNAKNIEEVPVPYVWVKPDGDGDDFVLSCEAKNGEKIKNPEYITYYWNIGGGDKNWAEREQRVKIHNNETMRAIKTFSCKMVNPVSEEESEPIENPLQKIASDNSGAVAAAVLVPLLLLLAAGVGLGYWKRQFLIQLFSRSSGTNGNVNPDTTNAEVETPLADESPDRT